MYTSTTDTIRILCWSEHAHCNHIGRVSCDLHARRRHGCIADLSCLIKSHERHSGPDHLFLTGGDVISSLLDTRTARLVQNGSNSRTHCPRRKRHADRPMNTTKDPDCQDHVADGTFCCPLVSAFSYPFIKKIVVKQKKCTLITTISHTWVASRLRSSGRLYNQGGPLFNSR